MKYFYSLLFSLSFFYHVDAQDYLFDNSNFWNYGNIDLSTILPGKKLTTTRSSTAGKYTNYGAGKFINNGTAIQVISSPNSWVDGYVRHYATSGNTSHVYPVGSESFKAFVGTTGEIINHSIATAWLSGDPSGLAGGSHTVTAFTTPITAVSIFGQWDWIASYTSGNVNVSVKPPPSAYGNADVTKLRLVGWNGISWINLGTSGLNAGVLSGVVPPGINALGIGTVSTGTTFRMQGNRPEIEKSKDTFEIFPNPVNNGIVKIRYRREQSAPANVFLFAISGQLILEETVSLDKDSSEISIDLQKLAAGTYILQLVLLDGTQLINDAKLIIK
ncbi:MAG: hypothetical protein CFE23_15160 [Flavobacterium sp. BFFFF1]|uniref:T9SS type A sorting domain-containing protein n=1 Tax=Flavobacterium sp. BFFFF1 TaxID=2015557 RepID=UPI000BD5636B|nr:T9SS type A sorting domain-containing protein [Flavobacterium sp. BFFFF1]OYU79214.1 MAG: hypothetical protein CFE23_15160 [Flavobacterium sp. BFFFF1]